MLYPWVGRSLSSIMRRVSDYEEIGRASSRVDLLEAQADLRKQHQTSCQVGYISSGIANNTMEMFADFSNLEQATAEDIADFANLTTENITHTNQVVMYSNRLSTN